MIATIHTYGHIDSMFYVLNAIAALTKTSTIMPLIQTMCLLAASYYAVKMAYGESSHQNRQYLLKTFGMLLVINLAIVPKTPMIIRDHVTKHQEKVDNLPYGFVVPVAILEHFGDVLTAGFEQAFQVVGAKSTNYRDYGMVFGARLVQESRNFRIKNPEMLENMDNFIKRCVIREAMIGKNYTPAQLLNSSDIWSLVKRHASRLRQVPIRMQNDRKLLTCAVASRVIESSFTGEIANLNAKYHKSDFSFAKSSSSLPLPEALQNSQNSRLNQTLSTNIQNAFKAQIGVTGRPAESIIKQQMMINAMHNFSDDYGFARASATQESSWRLSGDLSTIYLPMLLTVMKGIFYASFIFLVPLMLLSGGMSKYLGYLSVIASLQLWPALNSILNMFIDLYSAHTLPSISGSVISFSTSSLVGDYTDKIVAVASGLQMVVPFLAFGVIQGGVSGFMNIAGTITGATQSAATSVAHEVTTGNRSLDNISTGNIQKAMQSGFKTDLNSSYAGGASSYQHMDGTIEKTLADGETIYSSGAGITTSSGATNVETRMVASSQTSDTYSLLQSMAESSQAAYTDSETATMNHSLNSLVSLSKHDESGASKTTDINSSESKITQQAQNYMRHLRDTFGYTHEQAAAAYLKGSLDLEIAAGKSGRSEADSLASSAKSKMSNLLSSLLPRAALSGGGGGSFTASNADTQSLTDETASSIDNSHIVAYSTLETALASEHYATSDTKDKTLADDIRASREHTNQLARNVDMRSEDLRSFGSNITNSEAREVIITHESRDEMVNQISSSADIHPLEAHRSLEKGDEVANQSLKAKGATAKQDTESSMQSARQYFVGDERHQDINAFGAHSHQKINDANSSNAAETRARSAHEGVTQGANDKATEDAKAKIGAKADSINTKATNELKIKAKAIQMEHGEHRDKAQEAEQERKTSFGRKNNN